MDMGDFAGRYLRYREAWIYGLLCVVYAELSGHLIFLDFLPGEIVGMFPVFSILLCVLAGFILWKFFDFRGRRKILAAGFTFAVLEVLRLVGALLYSAYFYPESFFYSFEHLSGVFSSFIIITGVLAWLNSSKDLAVKNLALVFAGFAGALALFLAYEQPESVNALADLVFTVTTLISFVYAFFALYSVNIITYKTDLNIKITALSVFTVLAFLSPALGLIATEITSLVYPEEAEHFRLMFVDLEYGEIAVAATGIIYTLYLYFQDLAEFET